VPILPILALAVTLKLANVPVLVMFGCAAVANVPAIVVAVSVLVEVLNVKLALAPKSFALLN